MPYPHWRCSSLGSVALLGLLATSSAAHAEATYFATAFASITIDTRASSTFTITITPGTSVSNMVLSPSPPTLAGAQTAASETSGSQYIAGGVGLAGFTLGLPGTAASSSASASDTGATLMVTNLTDSPFIYEADPGAAQSSTMDVTQPGEIAQAFAESKVYLNGNVQIPTGPNDYTLAADSSDVWTIASSASGSAFSPATPEPGSLALLLGLTGAAFLRRKRAC